MNAQAMIAGRSPRRYRGLLFVLAFGAVLTLAWGFAPQAQADPVSLEVFTDAARFPVTGQTTDGVNVTIYDLAAPQTIAKTLSVGLPADPEAARLLAAKSIDANQASLTNELKVAYQGQAKALEYDLSHYPALVFNGTAVIYGLADIGAGLKRFYAWHERQQP